MTVGRPRKENFYMKQDFISHLQQRGLAPATIRQYLFDIELFLAWTAKEEIQVTKPDILRHLDYLKNERKQQNVTRSVKLLALNHYFTFLYQQEKITLNPCAFLKIRGTTKTTLYRLYTPEELQELYDRFYLFYVRDYNDSHVAHNQRRQSALSRERNAVLLNVLIHQGLTTRETALLKVSDIDLTKATLKAGKLNNERILPLKATQIGILIHYLQHIRPQLLEYHPQEPEQFFLPLPCSGKRQVDHSTPTDIMNAFGTCSKYIKSIDTGFCNFNQIRTSVITHWIKTEGLRKAQALAGHKCISSTERYRINDLEQLTGDISRLHPF